MGRSGGGGGHIGGGHRSHHSSSHIGSHSSHSSSSFHSGPSYRSGGGFGGGYGGGPRPGYNRTVHRHYHYNVGPHGYNYGPGAPPPPPRGSAGTNASGCLSIIITMIIFMAICGALAMFSGGSSGGDIGEFANQKYDDIFKEREDGLLIVISEDDVCEAIYGNNSARIMDNYMDYLWERYDANYNNDLGIQLGTMFADVSNTIRSDAVSPIKSEKKFSRDCYRDDINWVDTKTNLMSGAEMFYDTTGIQPYVLLVKNSTIKANSGSGPQTRKVVTVLIVAITFIVIVSILFSWWKKRVAQKNKEQEDLEKILSKPLESFGDPLKDLESKYDDPEK